MYPCTPSTSVVFVTILAAMQREATGLKGLDNRMPKKSSGLLQPCQPLGKCPRRGTTVYTVNSRLLHDGYTEGLLNEQPPASSAGKDPPIGRACGTATPNDAASRVDFKRMLSGRGTHPDRGATRALFLSPEIPSALLQEGTENIGVAVGSEIERTGSKDYVPGSIDNQEAGILDDDALTLKFHSDGRPCHACRPIRQVDREVQDARV